MVKHPGRNHLKSWELEEIRFVNGTVTYTRHDNSTLMVDFSNTFELNGNKIKEYRIFIDNSELFKQA